MKLVVERENVLEHVRLAVEKLGGVTLAAKAWGISQGYLSHVLNGNKPPGEKILKQIGYRKHEAYSNEAP